MILAPPDGISWLFLDLNSYFASVEQHLNPLLRGKPVAVVPLETDSTSAIAASYEAKAYGIKTNTRIYDAKKICPELICVLANHENYVDLHHKIIKEIERHIPVSIVASIDEVACELDSTQRNVKTATKLAKSIKSGIAKNIGESIKCSIGIAPNSFLAKIATNMQKPDGLVVIEPKDIPHKLYDVTFSDITGLGKNMSYRLQQAGITNMRELYNLSPKHMRAIWHSVEGERMYYQIRGIQINRDQTTRRTVGHSHVLSPENRPLENAILVGKRLLLKAISRMRRLDHSATMLSLSLKLENGKHLTSDTNFKPLKDHISINAFFDDLWARATQRLVNSTIKIKKIGVTLHGLVKNNEVQQDLFDIDQEDTTTKLKKDENLSKAIDVLNQRFGRGTIITASTLGKANSVTGTKIAFSRIPDKEEFKE